MFDTSGGQAPKSRTQKTDNRAGWAFQQAAAYENTRQERGIAALKKKAAKPGFSLTARERTPVSATA
ncbi:MAG: hypothetical protein HY023_15930 [Chloroflexi bacterium]|nr:hypothetical protein [Chloroflexota bacterium]